MTDSSKLSAEERDALTLLGRLFLTQGFPDRSVRIFAALEVLEPEDLYYKRALALAYLRAGRAQESLSTLDRLAERGGIDEGFHFVRSHVLGDLDRKDEAAAAMRAYLDLKDPPKPEKAKAKTKATAQS